MWTFELTRRSGKTEKVSEPTYESISKRRTDALFGGPTFGPVEPESVMAVGPITCVICGSFYLPDGRDGPDCECD